MAGELNRTFRDPRLKVETGVLDCGREEVAGSADEGGKVDVFTRGTLDLGIRLGNLQHRVDEIQQDVRLGMNLDCQRFGEAATGHFGFRGHGEARERRAQVVCDVIRQMPEFGVGGVLLGNELVEPENAASDEVGGNAGEDRNQGGDAAQG